MKKSNRREVLLAVGAAAVIHRPKRLIAMTQDWSRVPPGEEGFAADLEARLDKAVAEGRIWNVHGLVVLRNQRVVLERYFEGEDQARGVGDIGHIKLGLRAIEWVNLRA